MEIGQKVDEDVKFNIFKRVNELLNIDNPIFAYKFIGNHPISLTNDNIILLLKNDYMVCEKSDGVRMLCLTIYNKIYFYDRKNDVYEIQYDNLNIGNSIIDGELFYDHKKKLNYGIFDCLVYNNEIITDKPLLKRLYYCEQFVTSIDFNINFYVKSMYKSYGFLEIYNQIKNLNHKNDGLIFTPVNDKYILYKRGTHLKWKPPEINTIDFRLKQRKAGLYALTCTYKNNEIIFDYFETDHNDLDGKIGEFVFDKEKIVNDIENDILKIGGWVLYKIREDKNTPNHYRVVNNILESLDDNLDMEELSRYYKPMRNNYKIRETLKK